MSRGSQEFTGVTVSQGRSLFFFPLMSYSINDLNAHVIGRDVAVIGISKILRYKFVPVICTVGL